MSIYLNLEVREDRLTSLENETRLDTAHQCRELDKARNSTPVLRIKQG